MKTKNFEVLGFSGPQIEALVEGVDHKLSRSTMGWSYDDRVSPTDALCKRLGYGAQHAYEFENQDGAARLKWLVCRP